MRFVHARVPRRVLRQSHQERVFVQDGSMDPNFATVSKSLLDGSKEPSTELCSTILVLHLLIIFQIVTYDKARPTASPLSTSDFLLRAARKNTKLVPVGAFDDDVGLGVCK